MKDDDRQLDLCVKCGTCRTMCPVFRVTGEEGGVARGKISILQALYRGNTRFSEETLDFLNQCVTCGSCEFVCPRDVPFLQIIENARAKALRDGQISLSKKIALKLISGKRGISAAAGLGRLLPGDSGLQYKLPLIKRHIPKPGKSLDSLLPPFSPPLGRYRFDVLYFPGCAMRYLYTETAKNLVTLLNRLGVGVFLDFGQKCCGFPHLTAGDTKTFEQLMSHNNQTFSAFKDKIKYIVTACATCGSALKNNYELPVEILDINELLVDVLDAHFQLKSDKKRPVTRFHHPCHLMKHQHVKDQPEDILKEISDFGEMEGADFCCGFGGSFSVFEGELSRGIGDKKAEMIKQSFAETGIKEEVLVTSCPGCILQLSDSLKRNGIHVPVKHIVDVIIEYMEESHD
ncbi:MAG: (Fe-S)-binding protein [Acidobacteria bacterium]|nr:(Fe-S)-binding protein [Acidobacteriota bacterium]